MESRGYIRQDCLHFSCWSKKGYSIFAGLGREVRISRLATPMYESVLLKSASHGVIINTDSTSEVIPLFVCIIDAEKVGERSMGEVCPDHSSIDIPQRDIWLSGIYPFFTSCRFERNEKSLQIATFRRCFTMFSKAERTF